MRCYQQSGSTVSTINWQHSGLSWDEVCRRAAARRRWNSPRTFLASERRRQVLELVLALGGLERGAQSRIAAGAGRASLHDLEGLETHLAVSQSLRRLRQFTAAAVDRGCLTRGATIGQIAGMGAILREPEAGGSIAGGYVNSLCLLVPNGIRCKSGPLGHQTRVACPLARPP